MPVVVASTSGGTTGAVDLRASSARLFAGHESFEWLRICFSSIQQLSVSTHRQCVLPVLACQNVLACCQSAAAVTAVLDLCISSLAARNIAKGCLFINLLLHTLVHFAADQTSTIAGKAANGFVSVGAHIPSGEARPADHLSIRQIPCQMLCHGPVAAGHC